MSISTLVSSLLEQSDSQIVEILNTPSIQKTDATRYTSAKVAQLLTPNFFGQIDEALKATPGVDWIRFLLAGAGIDFSDPNTQESLTELEPLLGDATVALKSIGIWHVSPWVDAGNSGSATAEDVAAIRSQIVAQQERDDVNQWWTTLCNEVVNPMLATSTAGEIKAAIAGSN